MQVSIINEMKMIKKDAKNEKNIQTFVIFEGSPKILNIQAKISALFSCSKIVMMKKRIQIFYLM